MNVYDFDGTIYDGDSSVDFFKYCCKHHPKCIKALPAFFLSVLLYFLKIYDKEKMKSSFFRFIIYVDDLPATVDAFWSEHKKNIKTFYILQKHTDDIIISASPHFLLQPICTTLGIQLISTLVDPLSGVLIGKNCHGEEKVTRFYAVTKQPIHKFYSDSLSDKPLAELADTAFIVKGNTIIPWNDYKESTGKKLMRQFISPDFVTFVFLGCINAFNGIWISLILSNFIPSKVLAYIFGFLISMTIAYFLNSFLNFKVSPSIVRYLKFSMNNIPNFIIQVSCVIILLNFLHWHKVIAYSISAIIAVPITFLLVKHNVFNQK